MFLLFPVGKPDHRRVKDFTSHFQKSQSHRTPSSHKVLEKQVGRQPSEKPSKFRKQPSEKPFKQHSEQDLPTSRISWDDGKSKGNSLLFIIFEILL